MPLAAAKRLDLVMRSYPDQRAGSQPRRTLEVQARTEWNAPRH
jgi:hypothetical protein